MGLNVADELLLNLIKDMDLGCRLEYLIFQCVDKKYFKE